jgi:hypothetical protein
LSRGETLQSGQIGSKAWFWLLRPGSNEDTRFFLSLGGTDWYDVWAAQFSVSKDYERTYFEVWGELPPKSDGAAPQIAVPGSLSAAPPPDVPAAARSPQPAGATAYQLSAEAELDRKANEVIQRMMVDTLRRVESRLAIMDEHQADSKATIPAAVQDLCEQLSNLADEIARFLQRTRRINEELAGIQIESAKNLALIAKKVKELESRPLHWPPK